MHKEQSKTSEHPHHPPCTECGEFCPSQFEDMENGKPWALCQGCDPDLEPGTQAKTERGRKYRESIQQIAEYWRRTKNNNYRPTSLVDKLAYLVEEAGEVQSAVGKTLRWGLDSCNPELTEDKQEDNRDWLLRELTDLEYAIKVVRLEISL